MDFRDVQAVFRHVKDEIVCPHCGSRFDPKKVDILGLVENFGLATVYCAKCDSNMHINFAIKKVEMDRKHRNIIDVEVQSNRGVTVDDVLDVSNFVQTFQGDLKDHL